MQNSLPIACAVMGTLGLVVCADLLLFAPLGDASAGWGWLSDPKAGVAVRLACAPLAFLFAVGACTATQPIQLELAKIWTLLALGAGIALWSLRPENPTLAKGALAAGAVAGAIWIGIKASGIAQWAQGAAPGAVVGVLLAFFVPLLIGDPAPARSGLALILTGGALLAAQSARASAAAGNPFEITSREGGLGGGLRSLRISTPLVFAVLALALAGAAVGTLSLQPATDAAQQKPDPKKPAKAGAAEQGKNADEKKAD